MKPNQIKSNKKLALLLNLISRQSIEIILVASTVFKEVREDHELYDVTINNEDDEVSKQK